MRTHLLKLRSQVFSLFVTTNRFFVESPSPDRWRQKYAIRIQKPITGIQVLTRYPTLCDDGLASLIEGHLWPEASSTSLLHPLIFLGQIFNPQTTQLETYGCPPITREPHTYFYNYSKYYDFSHIVFELEEIESFMDRVGAQFEVQATDYWGDCTELEDLQRNQEIMVSDMKSALDLLKSIIDNTNLVGLQKNNTIILTDMKAVLSSLQDISDDHQKSLKKHESFISKQKEFYAKTEEALKQLKLIVSLNDQLKILFPGVKEIFQNIFKSKKKIITSNEFISRFKKISPSTPEYIILGFWALLAPFYKAKGRPKFQDPADYGDEKV